MPLDLYCRKKKIVLSNERKLNGRWSKDSIATAGHANWIFFHGQSDLFQCAFCAGGAGNWEEGDVPIHEHMKHFETCLFVQAFDVESIP